MTDRAERDRINGIPAIGLAKAADTVDNDDGVTMSYQLNFLK